jgi:undecaprenyl-diphosphatase
LIAWTAFEGCWDGLDAAIAGALAGRDSTAVRMLSALHGPRSILAGLVLAVLVFAARRRTAQALAAPVLVLGGAALNHLVKHTLQRPRPGLVEGFAGATDFAFPSGHVANATLLYGALVALAWPALRSPRSRAMVLAAATTLIVLVAAARVAAGAHRFSDVVAAPPLALGWLWWCLAVAAAWRRRGMQTRDVRIETTLS